MVALKDAYIGMRVVACVTDYPIRRGDTGEICAVDGPTIGVRWDKDIGFHDCSGHCDDGHGWWVLPSDIDPESTLPDIDVGGARTDLLLA